MNKRRKGNSVWTTPTRRRKRRRECSFDPPKRPFNNIPTSVVLRIFSYVDFSEQIGVVAAVCRGWRALILSVLLPACSGIVVKSRVSGEGALLAFTANHCSQIRSICLSGMAMNNKRLEGISACFRHIERIDLSNAGRSIQDTGIALLCKNCTHLRSVILRRCYDLGDPSAVALAECHNLEEVNMKFCHYVTSGGLRIIVNNRGASLRSLVFLRDCVNSASLVDISQHCVSLRHLCIQQSPIRGRELLELASCCTALRHINVRYCANLREDDIIKFQKRLPSCRVAFHVTSKRLLKYQHEADKRHKQSLTVNGYDTNNNA